MVLDIDVSSGFFVHISSEEGDPLNKLKVDCFPRIAFHRASEHVVVAGEVKGRLQLQIFTKDGEFVRSTEIHVEGFNDLRGLTVTTEGRIAVVFEDCHSIAKVLVL